MEFKPEEVIFHREEYIAHLAARRSTDYPPLLTKEVVKKTEFRHRRPNPYTRDGRALVSLVSGGPAMGLAVHPGVILSSGDQVALDVQGVRLLQNYAAVNHLNGDAWALPQIKTAVKHGLGARDDDEWMLVR